MTIYRVHFLGSIRENRVTLWSKKWKFVRRQGEVRKRERERGERESGEDGVKKRELKICSATFRVGL